MALGLLALVVVPHHEARRGAVWDLFAATVLNRLVLFRHDMDALLKRGHVIWTIRLLTVLYSEDWLRTEDGTRTIITSSGC